MYVRVWQYDVPAERVPEFERVYGPEGAWARLFAASPGFVSTELFADVAVPGRYLSVDRFTSLAAWEQFLADHGPAYADLGRSTEGLTLTNQELASSTAARPSE